MKQIENAPLKGTIAFGSLKGGSGTSTIAAVTALKLSEQGSKVLLVDNGRQSTSAAILGLAEPAESEIVPVNSRMDLVRIEKMKTLPEEATTYDFVVIDTDSPQRVKADKKFLVTKNCYLSARIHATKRIKWDGMVVNYESDRPLTAHDMETVLGLAKVAVVEVKAEVGRASDAGTLASRHDKFHQLDELSDLARTLAGDEATAPNHDIALSIQDCAIEVEGRINQVIADSPSVDGPFDLPSAILFGVTLKGALDLEPLGAEADVYDLLESPVNRRAASAFDAVAMVTCGWASPLDGSEGDIAPSEHPERRRVRLCVVADKSETMSFLRFGDDPDEVITDPGTARGPLADALQSFLK